MILCARNTSRSREQSKKRRSRSENMWKVCFFCSQNRRKKVIMKHDRHICLRNSLGAQRFWVLYPWLCFSNAHWLGRQTPIIWSYEVLLQWYLSQEDTGKVSTLGRGYLSEVSLHGRCPPIKVLVVHPTWPPCLWRIDCKPSIQRFYFVVFHLRCPYCS